MSATPPHAPTAAGARRDAWNAPGAAYHELSETLRPAAELLVAGLPVTPGMRVLDTACGTGLATFIAAAHGASATGLDFAPNLVAAAQRQAHACESQHPIRFDVGDIEQLPYADESFDAIISNFGMIFAPDHPQVVAEAARVLRPDGLLCFTAWTPEEPNLRLMTITSRYLPPPAATYGVFDWGCDAHIEHMLDPHFADITLLRDNVPWLCPSPAEAIDMLLYRALGPTMTAFRSASLDIKRCIHRDCIDLFSSCLASDGSVRLDRHYVTVRCIKR